MSQNNNRGDNIEYKEEEEKSDDKYRRIHYENNDR